MDFATWEPIYEKILDDFAFDSSLDAKSAVRLSTLLRENKNITPFSSQDLFDLFSKKDALIFGPAPIFHKEVSVLPPDIKEKFMASVVKVAADTAVELFEGLGFLPELIVSDLDGPIDLILKLNSPEGGDVPLVIHAHGDNIEKLEEVCPKLTGRVMGTCQCRPEEGIYNFGGFTDGDRAFLIADNFAASSIGLVGFDFDNPVEKPGSDHEVKLKKLGWARKLIMERR